MGRRLNARLAIREKQAKLSRLLTRSSSVDSDRSCLNSSTSSTSYHRRYKARNRLHKPNRDPPCGNDERKERAQREHRPPTTTLQMQKTLQQREQLWQQQISKSPEPPTSNRVQNVNPSLTQNNETFNSLIPEPYSKLRDTTVSTATSSSIQDQQSIRSNASNNVVGRGAVQDRSANDKEIWKMQSEIPLTTTVGAFTTTSTLSTNHTHKYPQHKFKEDEQQPAIIPLMDASMPMDFAVEEEYRRLRKYNLDLKNEKTAYEDLMRKLKLDLNSVTKNYQNNTIEWHREVLALKSQITDKEIQYARLARISPIPSNSNQESTTSDQRSAFSWTDRINKSEAKPNRETLLHYLRQSESLIATLNSSLKSETLSLDAVVEEREGRLQQDTDLIRDLENQVLDIRRKRNKKKGRAGLLLPWS